MLTLNLPVTAEGSQEESDPWPLLEVSPELLDARDQGMRSSPRGIRFGWPILLCNRTGLGVRLDRFVQTAPPRTRAGRRQRLLPSGPTHSVRPVCRQDLCRMSATGEVEVRLAATSGPSPQNEYPVSRLLGALSLGEQASLRRAGTGPSAAAAPQNEGEADRKHGT